MGGLFSGRLTTSFVFSRLFTSALSGLVTDW